VYKSSHAFSGRDCKLWIENVCECDNVLTRTDGHCELLTAQDGQTDKHSV